jgi:hypothetical protein
MVKEGKQAAQCLLDEVLVLRLLKMQMLVVRETQPGKRRGGGEASSAMLVSPTPDIEVANVCCERDICWGVQGGKQAVLCGLNKVLRLR